MPPQPKAVSREVHTFPEEYPPEGGAPGGGVRTHREPTHGPPWHEPPHAERSMRVRDSFNSCAVGAASTLEQRYSNSSRDLATASTSSGSRSSAASGSRRRGADGRRVRHVERLKGRSGAVSSASIVEQPPVRQRVARSLSWNIGAATTHPGLGLSDSDGGPYDQQDPMPTTGGSPSVVSTREAPWQARALPSLRTASSRR